MADLFLETLRTDWQVGSADPASIAARHGAYRRSVARRHLASLAGVVLLGGLFVAFVWMSLARRDALLGVAALAFLAGLLVTLTSVARERRRAGLRYDTSPEGHLQEMRAGMEAELRLLWGARWVSFILVLALVAAIGLAAFGYAPASTIFVLALAWGLTAAAVWRWQGQCASRLRREMDDIAVLLQDLERASDADR